MKVAFFLTVQRAPPPLVDKITYWDIEDLKRDLHQVAPPWTVVATDTEIKIGIVEFSHITTLVTVHPNLEVTVEKNQIPLSGHFSVKKEKICSFLAKIITLKSCKGVVTEELQAFASLPSVNCTYYRHVLCTYKDGYMCHSSTVRYSCCLGQTEEDVCEECAKIKILLQRKHQRTLQGSSRIFSCRAPLQKVAKERLVVALRESRRSERQLKKEKDLISKKLTTESVPVSDSLHKSLKDVMTNENISDAFLKLFWSEQSKAFQRQSGGMRWHPMLIRFAILIHSQSSSAYNTLRQTGVLNLPGESTLRDYTNAIHPQHGFNPEVVDEIKKAAAILKSDQRWVVLLHDEMMIKSDLVHDQVTGEIVGFVNSSNWSSDAPTEKDLASHVLVVMVVGIKSQLKMSLGYFPTKAATSAHLYYIFWKAVGILEIQCGLKVIASTCDKATPNQKFIRMHNQSTSSELCYKTPNLYALERHIFFFSDAPHLLKTVRNNLSSSKTGGTRYLWNNGKHLLWDHVVDLYKEDAGCELYRTKLTDEHIYLTPHSVMRVNLAVQVLSQSVGNIMAAYGGPDKEETAKFILLMDRFFDCLNVRALDEGDHKRKPDLMPYHSLNDPRFKFLQEDFLGYLQQWRETVMAREGFTRMEKNKMFLSYQTFEGLQITVKSVVEATQYLLSHGVDYVLTQVFCQDPLEEHFSRHRALGRRATNPTLWGFGYQENKLRLQ